jgi:hypothetical protein
MTEYAPMEPEQRYVLEEPVGRVRWVIRDGQRILQQRWAVKHYVGSSFEGLTGEWRDVPVEKED